MPSNALHDAFRSGSASEQASLIQTHPELLGEEDDSWECWLPLHHAARWGASEAVVRAALAAHPDAAKTPSKGGYEPLHLGAMGGYCSVVRPIIAVYPEGVLRADARGRTPLDEAREGGFGECLELMRALPGVREADEAQRALRAQRAEADLARGDAYESGDDAPLDDAAAAASEELPDAADAMEDDEEAESPSSSSTAYTIASSIYRMSTWLTGRGGGGGGGASGGGSVDAAAIGSFWTEKAKYIPLRLEPRERKLLRLLEGLLHVSEYTDRVDAAALHAKPAKRRAAILREVHATLSGLLLACNYEAGQEAAAENSHADYAEFFETIFEVSRRYKILNPEKLRDVYGKLIYLLQDASEVADDVGFSVVVPVRTVHAKLAETGALALLQDPLVGVATQTIKPEPGKSRHVIQREIKAKEGAIETLARRYANRDLPAEELRQCLYSIGDNQAYLYQARDPVDRMLALLREHFDPESPPLTFAASLAIAEGTGGARLTHDHARQYAFVEQSLTLWREVANDMFRLWWLAEDDLLRASNKYEQRDTGQGLQRVQQAPRVGRAMGQILHAVRARSTGGWVGSSLIHLGDSNVPNALMFIDKYSAVEHILNPILRTLDALAELRSKDATLAKWIDGRFGSAKALKVAILADFFKYAFDGSGADNFFDAGSCIDGRLTSAWHWCSQLPSKPFYIAFKLAGFTSFDGQFQT